MADWATRAAGAGVHRAWHFDSQAKLGGQWLSYSYADDWGMSPGQWGYPVLDLTQGCSSAGALGFSIPSMSGSPQGTGGNPNGVWGVRFGNAGSVQYGVPGEAPNQELWTQVRFKWDVNMIATSFLNPYGTAAGGWKVYDTATGMPLIATGTSSDIKAVIQTYAQLRAPFVYNYYPYNGATAPWQEATPTPTYPASIDLQNSWDTAPFCQWPNFGSCKTIDTPVWHTLLQRQHFVSRVNADLINVEGDLWLQVDGGAEIPLITWRMTTPGYHPMYWPVGETMGILYLFPYCTDLAPTVHPTCHIWYDEVIIASQRPLPADAATFTIAPTNPLIRRSRVKIA